MKNTQLTNSIHLPIKKTYAQINFLTVCNFFSICLHSFTAVPLTAVIHHDQDYETTHRRAGQSFLVRQVFFKKPRVVFRIQYLGTVTVELDSYQ